MRLISTPWQTVLLWSWMWAAATSPSLARSSPSSISNIKKGVVTDHSFLFCVVGEGYYPSRCFRYGSREAYYASPTKIMQLQKPNEITPDFFRLAWLFWRFLSGVISLSSWVLSLVNLAFCSLRFYFPFVFIASVNNILYSSLLLHFLCVCIYYALYFIWTEVWKVWSLAFLGETYLYIGITSSKLSRSFCLVSSSLCL